MVKRGDSVRARGLSASAPTPTAQPNADPSKVVGIVTELNAALATCNASDPDALPDIIAIVHAAVASMPMKVLQDYRTFAEIDLRAAAELRAERVADGELIVDADPNVALFDAAVLLRALEQVALQFDRSLESDLPNDLEAAWATSDGQTYVVRRVTALGPVDGKPFLKRGLLAYRVLPVRVDDLVIRLHRNHAVAGSAKAEALRRAEPHVYGAALFPGLKVVIPEGAGDFTVRGIEGVDAARVIARHLAEGRRDGCTAIVWPELTMPTASIDVLRDELVRHAFDDNPPDFLVAGSWHREHGGVTRNIATVLDGGGGDLFAFAKWAKYPFNGREEGIKPGTEIPVLVTEGDLVVMAICRDFLEDGKEPPYCSINADVAIVPSMAPAGKAAMVTMDGHSCTAHTMGLRFGTRTLVVQQPPQPVARTVGQVLALPARPSDHRRGTKVDSFWLKCPVE